MSTELLQILKIIQVIQKCEHALLDPLILEKTGITMILSGMHGVSQQPIINIIGRGVKATPIRPLKVNKKAVKRQFARVS